MPTHKTIRAARRRVLTYRHPSPDILNIRQPWRAGKSDPLLDPAWDGEAPAAIRPDDLASLGLGVRGAE